MEEQKYAYWLANISGVGIKTIHQLYKYCDNAREIYELGPGQLLHIHNLTEKTADLIVQSKKNWDVDGQWEQFLERGIQFYSMENQKYPKKLRHIYDMPYAIYVIGELPDEKEKSAAIVGARNCSPYGKKAAQEFGKKLAGAGVNLISGMARGIDSMGHRGALLAGGRTYAVLGCGVNIVYPPENWELYEQIAKHGGILSEYPPDMAPQPGFFPMRNRIISALSDVVIIIEAKEKSGSLITADYALDQGKDVFALPGSIYDSLSAGCNRLIKQGAGILLSPQDLLEELSLSESKKQVLLEKEELLVYSTLDLHPKSIEELAQKTGMDLLRLTEVIFALEERGFAEEAYQNYYRIRN